MATKAEIASDFVPYMEQVLQIGLLYQNVFFGDIDI